MKTDFTSKRCGQSALLPLDPSCNKNEVLNNLGDYPLPTNLQNDKKAFISNANVGIEVLKVSKVLFLPFLCTANNFDFFSHQYFFSLLEWQIIVSKIGILSQSSLVVCDF